MQESRQREIDPLIYKYVGVSGVDKPRIIQVGYETQSLFAQLARKNLTLAASVGGLLLVTGFVVYFALRRILTAPLNQLVEAAKAVKKNATAANVSRRALANNSEVWAALLTGCFPSTTARDTS